MGKINLLPEHVVSKIAAGEVIQRPANVVKELIDNAIDANASRIKIYVEDGGLKKMKVIDDGYGLSKEDILIAFHPHSTSKVSEIDDLNRILTMGFRGEALNSIAAISKSSLASRMVNANHGHRLTVLGGELGILESYGMPVGTEITIENLFYNVPARKKFLKSKNVEFSNISKVVTDLALAHPELGFDLYHNSSSMMQLPPNQSYEERVVESLGETFMRGLIPVEAKEAHVNIYGYISRPQHSNKRQNNQYLFINNRPVTEKNLIHSVRSTYGNLLEAKSHPSFILHFKFAPELVDVNVHPRKEEVRIVNPQFIVEATKKAVLNSLQKYNLTYIKQGFKETNQYLLNETEIDDYASNATSDQILQVHNLYLIKQSPTGLVLIDQHAAHERILYEKFLAKFEDNRKQGNVKKLTSPELLNLSLAEFHLVGEYLGVFDYLGFRIEEFGKNTYKITHVPELLIDRNVSELVLSVLDDLANDSTPKLTDDKTKQALSYLACRSAIKAGDYLSPSQRGNLLKDLEQTKTKYTCPHGRPVKIEVSLKDLEKTFKRV